MNRLKESKKVSDGNLPGFLTLTYPLALLAAQQPSSQGFWVLDSPSSLVPRQFAWWATVELGLPGMLFQKHQNIPAEGTFLKQNIAEISFLRKFSRFWLFFSVWGPLKILHGNEIVFQAIKCYKWAKSQPSFKFI